MLKKSKKILSLLGAGVVSTVGLSTAIALANNNKLDEISVDRNTLLNHNKPDQINQDETNQSASSNLAKNLSKTTVNSVPFSQQLMGDPTTQLSFRATAERLDYTNKSFYITWNNNWSGTYPNIDVRNGTQPGIVITFNPMPNLPKQTMGPSNINFYANQVWENKQVYYNFFQSMIDSGDSASAQKAKEARKQFDQIFKPTFDDAPFTISNAKIQGFLHSLFPVQEQTFNSCIQFFKPNFGINNHQGIFIALNDKMKYSLSPTSAISPSSTSWVNSAKSYNNDSEYMKVPVTQSIVTGLSFKSRNFACNDGSTNLNFIPIYTLADEVDISALKNPDNTPASISANDYLLSNNYVSKDKIKQLVIKNKYKFIGNTFYQDENGNPYRTTIADNEIEIGSNSYFNPTTMKLQVDLIVNHAPKSTKKVFINGFNILDTTLVNNNIDVTNPPMKNPIASTDPKAITPSQLTDFLNANNQGIFQSYFSSSFKVNPLNESQIDRSQIDNGIIKIKSLQLNQYIQGNKVVQNSTTPKDFGPITLTGFNQQTNLKNKTLTINSLSQYVAQYYSNSFGDYPNRNIIANLIKKYLVDNQNTVFNKLSAPIAETDIQLGDVTSFNNKTGSVTLANLKIINNKGIGSSASSTPIVEIKGPITINGFDTNINYTDWKNKQGSTNQPTSLRFADGANTDPNDFMQNQLQNFLDSHIQDLFTNIPYGATVLYKNQQYNENNGSITVNVEISRYFSNSNKNFIIEENTPQIAGWHFPTVTINGFRGKTTITEKSIAISSLVDYVAQYLKADFGYQDQNLIINAIKKYLVDNQTRLFTSLNGNLTSNDIQLGSVTSFNNKLGTVTIDKITISNSKATDDSGSPAPSVDIIGPITISGFNTNIGETTWKNTDPQGNKLPVTLPVDNQSNLAPDEFVKNGMQAFLDKNINVLFNNVPYGTTLFTKNPQIDYTNGTVTVTADLSRYFDSASKNYIINDNQQNNLGWIFPPITITGFKTKTALTTNSLDISGLNLYVAQYYTNNYGYPNRDKITDIIKNFIVKNQARLFKNLAGNITLDDIQLGSVISFNNRLGSATIDKITILNSKAIGDKGGVVPTLDIVGNLTISGFKTGLDSTKWKETQGSIYNQVTLNYPQGTSINPNDFINNELSTFLNQHIDDLFINTPYGTTIIYKDAAYNSDNGTVTVKTEVSQYFAPVKQDYEIIKNSPTTAGWSFPPVVITGFPVITGMTTINPSIIDNFTWANDKLATDAKDKLATDFINQLKQFLIDNNMIKNTNPLLGKINPKDINITLKQASNLTASVTADVFILNDYFINNGVPSQQTQPIQITINGFKKLTPTAINGIVPPDPQVNVNEIINNPNDPTFINAIKQQIIKVSNPAMFPNGLPTNNNITITVNSNQSNTTNGQLALDISINTAWVDNQGNVQPAPFNNNNQPLIVEGFNKSSTTTFVNSKTLSGVETIAASNLANDLANQQTKNKIKQAILNSKSFIGLNNKPTAITINDFDISYVSADNFNGNVILNVTINNQFVLDNGKIVDSKTFPNILYKGFAKLVQTNIAEINMDGLSKINPSEFIKSDKVQLIKEKIIEQINTIQTNMGASMFFPTGNLTEADVEVGYAVANDENGIVNIKVRINKDYVATNGQIIKAPYSQVVVLSGFKKQQQTSWIQENWWVILAGISGLIALILVIIFIITLIRRRRAVNY